MIQFTFAICLVTIQLKNIQFFFKIIFFSMEVQWSQNAPKRKYDNRFTENEVNQELRHQYVICTVGLNDDALKPVML